MATVMEGRSPTPAKRTAARPTAERAAGTLATRTRTAVPAAQEAQVEPAVRAVRVAAAVRAAREDPAEAVVLAGAEDLEAQVAAAAVLAGLVDRGVGPQCRSAASPMTAFGSFPM